MGKRHKISDELIIKYFNYLNEFKKLIDTDSKFSVTNLINKHGVDLRTNTAAVDTGILSRKRTSLHNNSNWAYMFKIDKIEPNHAIKVIEKVRELNDPKSREKKGKAYNRSKERVQRYLNFFKEIEYLNNNHIIYKICDISKKHRVANNTTYYARKSGLIDKTTGKIILLKSVNRKEITKLLSLIDNPSKEWKEANKLSKNICAKRNNSDLKCDKPSFHYSEDEITELKNALNSNLNKSDIAEMHSNKSGRSKEAILSKLSKLEDDKKRETLTKDLPTAGVNLSNELRFSVTPKKVILYNDRFEVFF